MMITPLSLSLSLSGESGGGFKGDATTANRLEEQQPYGTVFPTEIVEP